ncbi:MAG TPA: SAM-dependent methyltransferase, partial [Armatimonadota bacterium]|nr:SAM-dependent methyltransferase [Armatimonadota bacterium]
MSRSAHITIVGLGPARLALLSAESLQLLRAAPKLILRTERHPAAQELKTEGIPFDTLDELYAQAPGFDQLYPLLAERVLREAETSGEGVVYAVPGHPLLGEESVRLVLAGAAERGLSTRVVPAPSFVDVVASA